VNRLSETKWRNRARLEVWAIAKGANVDYSCDGDGSWTVVVRWADGGRAWRVDSGPCESVEAACTTAIERLQAGGFNVPVVDGPRIEDG